MPCPSWQWHRTGSSWSPVRLGTLPVAPLWCDLGFVPNSRGNKAAANLRPMLTINNVRYAINMQYGSIHVHLPIHHICIKYLGLSESSPNPYPRPPACHV